MVVTAIVLPHDSRLKQMEVWERGRRQAVTASWELAQATWRTLNLWPVQVQTRSHTGHCIHLPTRGPGPVTIRPGILLFKVFLFLINIFLNENYTVCKYERLVEF